MKKLNHEELEVVNGGAGFADKFTSREIMQFLSKRHTMCA